MKKTPQLARELRRRLGPRSLGLWMAGIAFASVALNAFSAAQASLEFHRNLLLPNAEAVALSVEVRSGDVEIFYSRDGEVSISAIAQVRGNSKLDDRYFSAALAVEQSGNHVSIRQISNPVDSQEKIKLRFRIDVPFRTEVNSKVAEGKQSIGGILGPVEAHADRGDIKVSYVSKSVQIDAGTGNLDIQVVGEHVGAKVLTGNISGERLSQGISAETQDGDITLAVVGPSTAVVKRGAGRVEVSGARGLLTASTDTGDLRVKAVPHDDWKLSSGSGAIRLDLPPAANFGLDASTDSGELQIERDDLSKVANDLRQTTQQANAGGKRIEAHTVTGKFVIR